MWIAIVCIIAVTICVVSGGALMAILSAGPRADLEQEIMFLKYQIGQKDENIKALCDRE